MTTVYLAEKPSQAGDIARVLGIKERQNGYYLLNNGDIVVWARGHILELVDPKEYNPLWGERWSWEQLPMIPTAWRYKVVDDKKAEFNTIQSALKKATCVVIATDAGREGELIARELLEYCRYKGPIKRFWTSSLVKADIEHALANLKPGSETQALFEAALARQHCDNMYGLSGTRAATLVANEWKQLYSLGRVQTPTLALMVHRHWQIKNFVAEEFFELEAQVKTANGHSLVMKHAPADKEQKIKTKATADQLAKKASGARGPLRVTHTPEKEGAPLAFSLPALQMEANAVFGFTSKNTLKLAQALYEKKAITYPRTDCAHLAKSQIPQIEETLAIVARRFPNEVAALKKQGIHARPSTFDDSKLTDHHGIIPDRQYTELEGAELQLYTLVCQRYLQLLGADHEYIATAITLDANGVPFKTTGRQPTKMGWKELKLITSEKAKK